MANVQIHAFRGDGEMSPGAAAALAGYFDIDASVQAYLTLNPPAGVVDATTGGKGVLRLSGDLGGTAETPTVPGKVGKGDLVVNVKDYGATGDGITDDTTACQAAINAAPAGSTVAFTQGGTYKITSPLTIAKPLRLRGDSHVQGRIIAAGCNGINVSTGTLDVSVEGIAIVQAVLHTTTPNAHVGISIAGSAAAQPGYHVYRDVLIQGFHTGVQCTSLSTSTFDNVQVDFCHVGIDAYGTSPNNRVTGCHIAVGLSDGVRVMGSKGIALNGVTSPTVSTPAQGEGWMISDSLIFGADHNIDLFGTASSLISGCILDYSHVAGVRVTDNTAAAFASNIQIVGSYIAMAADCASGAAGVEVDNKVGTPPAIRGVRVIGNDFVVYPSGPASHGVHTAATNVKAGVQVIGNTFAGFNQGDIWFDSSDNAAIGNTCQSEIANHIVSMNAHNLVSDNLGIVYVAGAGAIPNVYTQVAGSKVCRAPAAPTGGTWLRGDRVVNSAPAVGDPKGWTCTVAGTPGTWVSEGNL